MYSGKKKTIPGWVNSHKFTTQSCRVAVSVKNEDQRCKSCNRKRSVYSCRRHISCFWFGLVVPDIVNSTAQMLGFSYIKRGPCV